MKMWAWARVDNYLCPMLRTLHSVLGPMEGLSRRRHIIDYLEKSRYSVQVLFLLAELQLRVSL